MKKLIFVFLLMFSQVSQAGVDLASTVGRIKFNGDGRLWLKMTNPRFDEYCKPGWYGFNLYIPESDPAFPYYYGLITSALANNQKLYIANISKFDGSVVCDLTKTGYGVVVLKSQ